MIDDVVGELRSMAVAATDATGYFTALYERVTTKVAEGIRQRSFDDPDRMDRFASVFASYYIKAIGGEGHRPRCWQACIDVANDADLLIVQQLLLGINAHINRDLPYAVVEVTGSGNIADVRRDFDAINLILANAYTDVMDAMQRVSRWTAEAALLGGGKLFNFSLHAARDQAWAAAERLVALDEAGRATYEPELDELVSVLSYLITRPPAVLRPVLWLARRLETHDARTVTRALLGS